LATYLGVPEIVSTKDLAIPPTQPPTVHVVGIAELLDVSKPRAALDIAVRARGGG
jgi:hypothetical protein